MYFYSDFTMHMDSKQMLKGQFHPPPPKKNVCSRVCVHLDGLNAEHKFGSDIKVGYYIESWHSYKKIVHINRSFRIWNLIDKN